MPLVHRAICDVCDTSIVGERFKCSNCQDYDECHSCRSRSSHDTSHIFIKAKFNLAPRFEIPIPHYVHISENPEVTCSFCKEQVLGTRYLCNACVPSVYFCENCELVVEHSRLVSHYLYVLPPPPSQPLCKKPQEPVQTIPLQQLTPTNNHSKDLIVRTMKKADIPRIMDIERQCFAHPWPDGSFHRAMKDSFCVVAVAQVGDTIVGFIVLRVVGHVEYPSSSPDLDVDDRFSLDNFCVRTMKCKVESLAVDEKFRRLKVAQSLFNTMYKICDKRSVSKITLHVKAANEPALNFYLKNQFSVSKLVPDYYENEEDPRGYKMVRAWTNNTVC